MLKKYYRLNKRLLVYDKKKHEHCSCNKVSGTAYDIFELILQEEREKEL